jgi:BspA type Leucine rich repeat region (6 copies)
MEWIREGSLEKWWNANKDADGKLTAKELDISRNKDITDEDFKYLKGIETLRMKFCNQDTITDAAFKHLEGIKHLDMWRCNQKTITNEALKHLKGIKTLNMSGCTKITDDAFENLVGIEELSMADCDQITGAGFKHLKGIKTLSISKCERITDAAFEHLDSMEYLDMSYCDEITDEAFKHFKNLKTLIMGYCRQDTITDAAFENLANVEELNIVDCSQPGITDEAFKHLKHIKHLNMGVCTQFTDGAFKYLKGIEFLAIPYCNQEEITDAAFKHLKGIKELHMDNCDQNTITGATLHELITPESAAKYAETEDVDDLNLKILDVTDCNSDIIDYAHIYFGVGYAEDFDSTETIETVAFYNPPGGLPKPVENDSKKWTGFTKADIKNLDEIFGDEGINYTICPICLAYSIRQDGCMYMYHNCKKINGNIYHKDLYKEYLDTSRESYNADMIEWCTICNRITKNHKHFKLSSADKRGVGFAHKPKNMVEHFQNDCTGVGGGGFREKVARFMRYAEMALELQEHVGKLSEKEAKYKLIEEIWNAPLYVDNRNLNRIIATKNLGKKSLFPNKISKTNSIKKNETNAPNIPFEGNKEDLPTKAGKGRNNVTMDEDVQLYTFHHKQPDGSKEQEHTTSIDGLIATIEGNKNSERISSCFKQPECKADIHPEELKSLIEEGFPKGLYEEYRKRYNKEFQAGGSRRGQTGGGNMIVEAPDALCLLPPKRHSRTRSKRGGNRRNTRRKTS